MVGPALALGIIAGQSGASASVSEELTQIEAQLAATWKSGECEAWGAFLAPELSVIHITADVITRSQALEMCQTRKPPLESLASDELSVRSFGDAAVVTGRTRATTAGEKPETVTLRFTDVFIRRNGRWQIVASHATRILP
jgi:ketosteroid isomerase-like protein